MVKAAGLVFLFIGSSLIGFMKSAEIKKRKDLLEDYKELILQISTRIGYFKEPIPVIFREIADQREGQTEQLLKCWLLYYEISQERIDEMWNKAVKDVYESEPLSFTDKQVLMKCGSFLGQSDYENQKKHFDMLNHQLDTQINDADEDIRTKGRMYSKMGVCMGALIAITLI